MGRAVACKGFDDLIDALAMGHPRPAARVTAVIIDCPSSRDRNRLEVSHCHLG
jgi:hypothetical protein